MNKIKVTTKDKQLLILIKGMKEQRILRHELDTINNNGVRGLLYLEVAEKKFSFQLVYNVTGYITLQKLLSAPQTRQSFCKILASIQKTLRSMDEQHFEERRLLLDFDKVMVNPATGEIMFVYVPLQPFDSGASLRTFMLDISSGCMFENGQDTSFLERYVKMISKSMNFSLVELERYLNELVGGKTPGYCGTNICPHCSAEILENANFCNQCGRDLRDNQVGNGNGSYRLQRNTAEGRDAVPRKNVFLDDDELGPVERSGTRSSAANDFESNIFGECGGDISASGSRTTKYLGTKRQIRRTTALGASNQVESVPEAYLIRIRTGEAVLIDRDVFRIGFAENTSDYAISDNEAISTKHAQIIRRNGRYYVVDVGSTNCTYVDRRMIRKLEEIEIFSGTNICFANEHFTFEIEDGR